MTAVDSRDAGQVCVEYLVIPSGTFIPLPPLPPLPPLTPLSLLTFCISSSSLSQVISGGGSLLAASPSSRIIPMGSLSKIYFPLVITSLFFPSPSPLSPHPFPSVPDQGRVPTSLFSLDRRIPLIGIEFALPPPSRHVRENDNRDEKLFPFLRYSFTSGILFFFFFFFFFRFFLFFCHFFFVFLFCSLHLPTSHHRHTFLSLALHPPFFQIRSSSSIWLPLEASR